MNINRYTGRCQLILTAVFFALYTYLCFPALAWIGYELNVYHILQKPDLS